MTCLPNLLVFHRYASGMQPTREIVGKLDTFGKLSQKCNLAALLMNCGLCVSVIVPWCMTVSSWHLHAKRLLLVLSKMINFTNGKTLSHQLKGNLYGKGQGISGKCVVR